MFGSSRETPPAGRRASKDVECATEEVTEELEPLVELPVCFAVPDEPVVAKPMFVFELLAVGGTVCAADDEVESAYYSQYRILQEEIADMELTVVVVVVIILPYNQSVQFW